MKLTIKQQKFADEYIIRGNATEAAIAAGYSPKTAHQIGHANLDKPHIKAYIQERLDQIQSEKIASQEEILEYLTSVMRGEEQEPVLKGMGEGAQEVIDINLQAKDRIKAAELLGKRYSLWTDKVDLDGGVSVTFIEDVPLDD
ncbi:Terminase small subunit [Urinicoccus massiliensis]|uniref:Terminase small subunit n=1 Tax=Urinicoccus massiliensis TaxID=1723382 RepID=A0A8H2M9L7_9FIRM|nr:terminase small subunit [Urinicoccus massiliensis]VFB17211.1 Terminase small subunit [Urinicoccus massiliensis]